MNWFQKLSQNRDRHLYKNYKHKPVSVFPMGGAGAFYNDWIGVVVDMFSAQPHPDAGTFSLVEKISMGQAKLLNESRTVSVELRMDAQFVGDASTLIYVSTDQGVVGSHRISKNMTHGHTPENEMKELAEAIVTAAYRLIDQHIEFSNDMGLAPDWKIAQV